MVTPEMIQSWLIWLNYAICSFSYIYFPIIYILCKQWLKCQEKNILNDFEPLFQYKDNEREYSSDILETDGLETDGYETDITR